MVNTMISIPGYVHLYRSLLRFYDMPEMKSGKCSIFEYGKPGLLRVLSPGPQCDPERTGRFLRMAGNEGLPPLPHRGTALQIAAVFEAQH